MVRVVLARTTGARPRRDRDTCQRLARQLDEGLIPINSRANLTIEFEEGGFKGSGPDRLGRIAAWRTVLEFKQIVQIYTSQEH